MGWVGAEKAFCFRREPRLAAGGADSVCFGQEHDLDFQRLLDASAYKEAFRRDMIRWGEEKRQADPGFFCRKVVEGVFQPVWVSGLCGSSLHPHLHCLPVLLNLTDVSCSGQGVGSPPLWSLHYR